MTETTELDRSASEEDSTTTAASAPTSVKAVGGFFAAKASATESTDPPPSLFKRFELVPSSWDALQQKTAQLEKPQSSASVPRRLKVVFLVRHAEGIHNAADKQFGTQRWESELAFQDKYLDADLTPFGVSDAQSKGPVNVEAELKRGMPPIERIVVSPLSRAIQTAQNFFAEEQVPAAPFVCMESCREILGCHTCDKRRSVAELRAKFPAVDFSAIKDEQDQLWTPTHRETDEEMQARAKVFLLELFRDIPEQNVAVVTHSGFMEALCAVVLGIRIHPANCEVIPLVLEAV